MSARTTAIPDVARPRHPDAAERIYHLLLRAYPPAFRSEYGPEMTQLLRDQRQMGDAGALGFWLAVVWDVAQSAPALRVEAWRARRCDSTRTLGVIMKLIAMLTVLLGVFGTANAITEGATRMRQGLEGTYLTAVVLGVVAGALLLVAGVAGLRGTPSARRTAGHAALASLVIFLLARLVFGWMSVFSQLVGTAMPLAILAMLYWPRQPRGAA
jgi:hypothetical protein